MQQTTTTTTFSPSENHRRTQQLRKCCSQAKRIDYQRFVYIVYQMVFGEKLQSNGFLYRKATKVVPKWNHCHWTLFVFWIASLFERYLTRSISIKQQQQQQHGESIRASQKARPNDNHQSRPPWKTYSHVRMLLLSCWQGWWQPNKDHQRGSLNVSTPVHHTSCRLL